MNERPHSDLETDLSIVAIIPLYNGAEFIERSIRTVLAQTRQPDEFFVVDDGSTDNGPDIVRSLMVDHPLIQLLSKENGGQSSARNFAVAHSKSALIALLDQDDGWYPDHLAELVKPFAAGAHFRLGWVYSNLDECDRFARMRNRRILRLMRQEHPKTQLSKCLADDMFILPSASLISRQAFESVGGFDDRLSGYEDDDLFVRLFHAGYDNVFLDKALSYWCIYPGSTSFSPRMAKSRMIYFEKLRESFAYSENWSYDPVATLIAPRFFGLMRGEMYRAEQIQSPPLYEQSVRDARLVLPYMPRRGGVFNNVWMTMMSSYRRARFLRSIGILTVLRTARRIAGRISR